MASCLAATFRQRQGKAGIAFLGALPYGPSSGPTCAGQGWPPEACGVLCLLAGLARPSGERDPAPFDPGLYVRRLIQRGPTPRMTSV